MDLEPSLESKSEELSFPESKFDKASHYEAIDKTTMVSMEPLEISKSTKYLASKNCNKDKVVRVKDTSISVMSDRKRHREHDYIDKLHFLEMEYDDKQRLNRTKSTHHHSARRSLDFESLGQHQEIPMPVCYLISKEALKV